MLKDNEIDFDAAPCRLCGATFEAPITPPGGFDELDRRRAEGLCSYHGLPLLDAKPPTPLPEVDTLTPSSAGSWWLWAPGPQDTSARWYSVDVKSSLWFTLPDGWSSRPVSSFVGRWGGPVNVPTWRPREKTTGAG